MFLPPQNFAQPDMEKRMSSFWPNYYERASAASERVHTELRENPEYERPAGRPWGRSSKANILGTGHPIDKRSFLLNVTWT